MPRACYEHAGAVAHQPEPREDETMSTASVAQRRRPFRFLVRLDGDPTPYPRPSELRFNRCWYPTEESIARKCQRDLDFPADAGTLGSFTDGGERVWPPHPEVVR